MSNLALRAVTAIVGVPLIIALIYIGGWPFAIVVAAASLGAQYEVYNLAEMGGVKARKWIGLALGLAVSLRLLLDWTVAVLLLGTLFLVATIPFRRDENPLATTAVTVLGAVYPTLFMAYLVNLRLSTGPTIGSAEAFVVTLTVFVLIWATDTFAYFTGKAFGKHPLAPAVSPKKTWEGAIGGAVGALGVAAVLRLTVLDFMAWHHVLAIAFICGALSQIGDLAESKLKRAVGAKDSGNLLPGHGGILDRIDALILAVPLVYTYLMLTRVITG